MKLLRTLFVSAALIASALFIGTIGPVQRVLAQSSSGMTQLLSLLGTEQIPLQYPCTVSCFTSSATLGNFGQTQPGGNMDTAIIGGDASTNLFQKATTGASVTTAVTYGGPDRWAYWSGTNTAMTVSRDTTAADLPSTKTFQAAFKMARTSGQTGVVQVCMIQEVETVNSLQFSGTIAEVDFHATAGANFSAANSLMTAYVITGTGTDEGTVNAAFGLNAGGGGGAGWTGQANAGVNFTLSTTNTRFTGAYNVPVGTTEIALALCFTPVGTASTNDYIAFSGIQLTRNASLASVAGTTQAALANNDTRAKAFARRPQGQETLLQQRYLLVISEPASGVNVAVGYNSTTSACNITLAFPDTMRAAPTVTFAGTALSASTWKVANLATTTAPSTPFLAVNGAHVSTNLNLTATTGATMTAGQGCALQGNGGGSKIVASAEL